MSPQDPASGFYRHSPPANSTMTVQAQVTIEASKQAVWAAISDIENAAQRISGIESVEILEKPSAGLVGLKWKEARTFLGKTATEVMWITDCVENEYYKTRAESHGSIYICKLSVTEADGHSTLTMTHECKAVSFMAKLMAGPMALLFNGTFRKMLTKDLNDIKSAVEAAG